MYTGCILIYAYLRKCNFVILSCLNALKNKIVQNCRECKMTKLFIGSHFWAVLSCCLPPMKLWHIITWSDQTFLIGYTLRHFADIMLYDFRAWWCKNLKFVKKVGSAFWMETIDMLCLDYYSIMLSISLEHMLCLDHYSICYI